MTDVWISFGAVRNNPEINIGFLFTLHEGSAEGPVVSFPSITSHFRASAKGSALFGHVLLMAEGKEQE